MNTPNQTARWSEPGTSRVPFWAYTDPALYQRELERLFYGPHWCYVGLAVEIPNTGDYKLSWVGERGRANELAILSRAKVTAGCSFALSMTNLLRGRAES